ncbi:MAG TPA: ABC transporter ATP-binding protein [Xanthobacteraceae bacterium]|nr:ABC transporter ATP-binding protein [Xanthobacteraceae bacterium]
MTSDAINLTRVTKIFGGAKPVRALDNVDLSIGKGQFAAIVGPSGCGKSTILNLVAGFEKPTSGEVRVDGKPVRAPGPDRAVVFQEAALFPWLSVWENTVFSARARGQPKSAYEDKARQFLARVGLADFHEHLPTQLSGGMKQRVGIARTLVMEPHLFLMDEPFGALDAQTRIDMQELLLSVWDELRRTVVFITHDVDEAILLADVVFVMSARPGRIRSRVPVELPRPRSIDLITDPAFVALKRDIFNQIRHEAQAVRVAAN